MQEVTFGRYRMKSYQLTVQNFLQRLREYCQGRGINFFSTRKLCHGTRGTAVKAIEASRGVGMIENSKPEIRNSKQIRNPNFKFAKRTVNSNFEFRICFEFRVSNFDFHFVMNFLAPFAFLFAASIPVVVVFYLLKRKRVVKLVSSTLLWQRFLSETQASAPFQKLRKNWLLIFQIILLIFTVLALSRPFFATKAKPAELRVVILDTSASMQSTDESPSRFEKARAEALKWVDGLTGGDQMVVLQAGANTEVKQSATSEKAALRRALQACVCSDGPTRLIPALRMAESLVRDQRNAEIHLFSDGAVPELSEFENKALPPGLSSRW